MREMKGPFVIPVAQVWDAMSGAARCAGEWLGERCCLINGHDVVAVEGDESWQHITAHGIAWNDTAEGEEPSVTGGHLAAAWQEILRTAAAAGALHWGADLPGERCGAESEATGRCELYAEHAGPHRTGSGPETYTWPPDAAYSEPSSPCPAFLETPFWGPVQCNLPAGHGPVPHDCGEPGCTRETHDHGVVRADGVVDVSWSDQHHAARTGRECGNVSPSMALACTKDSGHDGMHSAPSPDLAGVSASWSNACGIQGCTRRQGHLGEHTPTAVRREHITEPPADPITYKVTVTPEEYRLATAAATPPTAWTAPTARLRIVEIPGATIGSVPFILVVDRIAPEGGAPTTPDTLAVVKAYWRACAKEMGAVGTIVYPFDLDVELLTIR